MSSKLGSIHPSTAYRPFIARATYYAKALTHRVYRQGSIYPIDDGWCNVAIGFSGAASNKPFASLVVGTLPSFDLLEKTQFVPLRRLDNAGKYVDNVTDWGLTKFTDHYKSEIGKDKGARKITKEAIFHYCYAVLHDPAYREKYAQNLKREFPRIPFYSNFWQWAEWGRALMDLHIGYETVAPFALTRTDISDEKARAAGQPPKPMLRADKNAGRIQLDSETTLSGIPPEAWDYKLGNRSALDWILDQYKEKKPKDPTIREKFDTYRFADYKEMVIDLLQRVTTVSVRTVEIMRQMQVTTR